VDSDPINRLLVVDDEAAQVEALCHTLEDEGYSVEGFTGTGAALGALRERTFDIALTDLTMPGMDGIAFLNAARAIDPELAGIVMTGHGSISTAVEAMKAGAIDYILKPFDLRVILRVLERTQAMLRLRRENAALLERLSLRTVELETANRELRVANRELEAFSVSAAAGLPGYRCRTNRVRCRQAGAVNADRGRPPDAKTGAKTATGRPWRVIIVCRPCCAAVSSSGAFYAPLRRLFESALP
jgi:FixJ family two-component response regulator